MKTPTLRLARAVAELLLPGRVAFRNTGRHWLQTALGEITPLRRRRVGPNGTKGDFAFLLAPLLPVGRYTDEWHQRS
jgi:hypothetical protein